jgi:ankyrin repeat protein
MNLLKAGCAVNLRDEDGETGLFKACTRGLSLTVIKALVEHGAKVNI